MSLYGLSRAPLQALLGLILALLVWPALADRPPVILALGNSLTAGFGLPADKSFPAQLQARLAKDGVRVRVINAGVSGDTTAGGLARLDWALTDKPDIAIVELGANDGLRGFEPKIIEANLDAIVGRLKARGISVLLAGMIAPPNMGRNYASEYNTIFPAIAKRHDVPLYPFFLDGVAGDRRLNLPDGMHPTAEGIAVVVERILPTLRPLIDARKTQ